MPRTKTFDKTATLEQAMNLFWEKGYYATSVQDLVNHLGINRASLYDTYGGKKSLFEQAFQHYRVGNMAGIKAFFDAQNDVRAGFDRLFRMAVQQSKDDEKNRGCMVVNTTIEFIPNEEDFKGLIQQNKREFEKLFGDFLKKGVEKGQISKDKNLKAIATLFFTFYNGLKVVSKVDSSPKQFLDSVESLMAVLD